MEKIKRNRVLIWVAIFLLTVNLGLVSSIWIKDKSQNKTRFKSERIDSKRNGFEQRMASELNLNQDQIVYIKELKKVHRKKMNPIRQDIKQKKHLIHEELIKTNPDTNYINSMADSIGLLNASFEKMNYSHLIELKKELSQEQQESFKHLMECLSSDKDYHNKGKKNKSKN